MFVEIQSPKLMLLTLTFSLAILVAINLLLLKFSCNKTNKVNKVDKKPVVLKPQITLDQEPQRLAPTGS